MCKNGFGINNLQWLICNNTKPNQTKPPKSKKVCVLKTVLVENIIKVLEMPHVGFQNIYTSTDLYCRADIILTIL